LWLQVDDQHCHARRAPKYGTAEGGKVLTGNLCHYQACYGELPGVTEKKLLTILEREAVKENSTPAHFFLNLILVLKLYVYAEALKNRK